MKIASSIHMSIRILILYLIADISPKLTSVVWKGKRTKLYFQYGPSFDANLIPGVNVWATYEESGNGAALIVPFGDGQVGVLGPHPEATEEWFKEDGLPANQGMKLGIAKIFIRSLLKPTSCSDAISRL